MVHYTEQRLTVLYVEDSDTDFAWAEAELADYADIIHVRRLSECHRSGECDIALLDLNLEETMGIETVKRFRAGLPHLPVVVLTHLDDPKIEAACYSAGAHAYYRKGTFDPVALVRSMHAAATAYSRKVDRAEEIKVHRKNIDEVKEITQNILERLEAIEDGS